MFQKAVKICITRGVETIGKARFKFLQACIEAIAIQL